MSKKYITEADIDELQTWTVTADMFLSSKEGVLFGKKLHAVFEQARMGLYYAPAEGYDA